MDQALADYIVRLRGAVAAARENARAKDRRVAELRTELNAAIYHRQAADPVLDDLKLELRAAEEQAKRAVQMEQETNPKEEPK